MNRKVVALAGISGVGKTTFLKKLAKQASFQHLTGGSLIAAARRAEQVRRDDMRLADLEENQRLLIEGFAVARDPDASLVIMDGHVVIDDGRNLTELSPAVFRALEISLIVHLEADPTWIAANRSQDTSRSRPKYEFDTLVIHQSTSRNHAASIAQDLGISFLIVTHDDLEEFAARLSKYGYV